MLDVICAGFQILFIEEHLLSVENQVLTKIGPRLHKASIHDGGVKEAFHFRLRDVCSATSHLKCFAWTWEDVLVPALYWFLGLLLFYFSFRAIGGEWSSCRIRQVLSAYHMPQHRRFFPYLNNPIRTAATSCGGWSPPREYWYLG